jgi:hypothetical protein
MKKHLLLSLFWGFSLASFSQSTIQLASEVNLDSLVKTVREFSGEDSTIVNDSVVRIQHRVSNKGNNLAADYLVARLEALGLQVEVTDYRKNGRNIVATHKGKTNPDSIYILCSHYDAVADYCADDNASGSAAVLEAARIMTKYCFNNTVKFAFWDEEELGLIGSKYYADTAFAHNDRIVGVFNIDMMGYDGDSNKVFDIHTNANLKNQELKDTVLYVLNALKIDLVPNVINPGTNRSDHASFWNRGYPGIFCGESFIGGDPNPFYHSSKDRIDIFDLNYFHKIAQLAIGTFVELAGIIPTSIEKDTVVACDFYVYNDTTFHESTVYNDSLKTTNGCDSIYILHLTLLPHSEKVETISFCEFYTYKNENFYKSGIYKDTLVAANGCDSIYTIDLTILPIYRSTDTINACEYYVFNNKQYRQTGIYQDTFISRFRCDSIEIIDLTILPVYQWSDTLSVCKKYNYRNQVFTTSGIYLDTFISQFGCDSIYSLNLTIYPIPSRLDTIYTCDDYKYGNQNFSQSGIYYDTLISQFGCDSIYIFDLRITRINDAINKIKDQLVAADSSCSYQWLICKSGDFIPIIYANNRQYEVKENGFYAVQLNKNECVVTSKCFQVEVGSSQSSIFSNMMLFPNPSKGKINLTHIPLSEQLKIQLYNLNGELLIENNFSNTTEIVLELPNATGIYMLKVESEKGKAVYKVIKSD